MSASPEPEHTPGLGAALRSPFVPLLLLAMTLLGWMGIQTIELINDRRALAEASVQQATGLAAALKIRAAADSLASKMQTLADTGNPNALAVVAELKRRGISINPQASTPQPP
jgi:hypothetical protein